MATCAVEYGGVGSGCAQWSVRRDPCACGAWRDGIGRGKAVVEVQSPLVGWNAAPGSSRGSPASASGPIGAAARAARGVSATDAFWSAQCMRKVSSSPV
jgi:hypothetical protein